MTSYEVQYGLPVDKPENKVRVTKRKAQWVFEVPINHPDAHKMGFMDLLAAAELSGLLGLPTDLNNTDPSAQKRIIIKRGQISADIRRAKAQTDPDGSNKEHA